MRVAVVGGGVIGCAAALVLARRGVEVELLERGVVGSGASGAAAGMLAPLSESDSPGPFVEIGLSALREFDKWVEYVEELARMRVDFVRSGVLMLAAGPEQERALQGRQAWQRGYEASTEYLDAAALARFAPHLGPGFTGALHYPSEVQVDAHRYALALGRAAMSAGARLREGAAVTAILTQSGRAVGVEVAGERLAADDVVVATGSDASLLRLAEVELPLGPIKGESLRLLPARRMGGPIIFAPGGYLTPKADGSVLVGATQFPERHDLAVAAGSVATLLDFAFRVVPALKEATFAAAWAGLRPSLPDRLPAIGPVRQLESLWVAVGHHRNGILLAGWTAVRLAAAMLDGEPLPEALRPDRFEAVAASLPAYRMMRAE
jgi:glycine oxidase